MRAKDVLLEALQSYTGTVVFVSHDRYFMDKLATRVFEVEEGRVHVFPGNYEDYLWRKSGGPESVAVSLDKPAPTAPAPMVAKGAEKRVNPLKLQQMKDRQVAIEQKIASLESQIAEYESALSNFVSVEETKRTNDLLEAHKSKLAATLSEWEEVAQLTS
jgi:ATP-binding cassette, subfamily F, member 3